MDQFFTSLQEIIGDEITGHSAVSGGDISRAYRITTRHQQFFVKVNSTSHGLSMFGEEKAGLEAIAGTQTIRTPRVVYCGMVDTQAVLLMEYFEARQPASHDFAQLGIQLAQLHQVTFHQFGWDTDNYIGSLPQGNRWHQDWKSFYMECRLMPQLVMAHDAGLLSISEIPGETLIIKVLESIIGDVQPSLLHGDLWSGNYLIASDGTPYLIDPAVYYGHHEVDLAMTRLFGGFGERFYDAYHECIPVATGCHERSEIYQLYYLLVHLNLFGGSYRRSVVDIIHKYF